MKDPILKSSDDIKRIREAGIVIAEIFKLLQQKSLIDVSTGELDILIENIIHRAKARPAFKTVKNYNHATCISINSEVAHGIPSPKRVIKQGDIISIDIGVVKGGFFADACYTFSADPISPGPAKLLDTARESLALGIQEMIPGKRLGDVGAAIQEHVDKQGFSIVRDFTGHGVGYSMHELPHVPHVGLRNMGKELQEGMVLAVEPIVNEGSCDIVTMNDGWTIITEDGKLSAQFEHTIAVTDTGPHILTV